jgi:hypothetical protein
MLRFGPLERILQITRGVGSGPPDGDCIAEHLAAVLKGSMRRLDDATDLDPPQHLEQLWRRDASHRRGAEPRKDVCFKPGNDLVRVAGSPASALNGKPFARNRLERIYCRKTLRLPRLGLLDLRQRHLFGLPLLAWIEAVGEQPPRFIRLAPRGSQRRVWVRAQRDHLPLAFEAVVEAPAVRAALDEQPQHEPLAIAETLARIALPDRLDGRVRRDEVARHGVTPPFRPPSRSSYRQSYSAGRKNSRKTAGPAGT